MLSWGSEFAFVDDVILSFFLFLFLLCFSYRINISVSKNVESPNALCMSCQASSSELLHFVAHCEKGIRPIIAIISTASSRHACLTVPEKQKKNFPAFAARIPNTMIFGGSMTGFRPRSTQLRVWRNCSASQVENTSGETLGGVLPGIIIKNCPKMR